LGQVIEPFGLEVDVAVVVLEHSDVHVVRATQELYDVIG
jgi:hypothetical protein